MQGTRKAKVFDHFDGRASVVLERGESLEVLKSLPAGFAKLIITSPPYNIGKEYETKTELAQFLKEFTEICVELRRVLHPEGSICWQVGNFVHDGEVFPLDIYFYPIFKGLGLYLRNRIIWHFGHGLHNSKRFSGRYETILWFTKAESYTFNLDAVRVAAKYPGKCHYKEGPKYGKPTGNPLGKNPADVWEIVTHDWETALWNIPNVKANHPEKTIHVCQFPIELVERCVLALTNEGDWVLDPFAGVGSAVIAALRCKRRGMGIDREKRYLDEAIRRIHLLRNGRLPYRPLGKPVYQPNGREKVARIPEDWKTSVLQSNGSGTEPRT
jgi:adenine-specific DNA-methyltransferase